MEEIPRHLAEGITPPCRVPGESWHPVRGRCQVRPCPTNAAGQLVHGPEQPALRKQLGHAPRTLVPRPAASGAIRTCHSHPWRHDPPHCGWTIRGSDIKVFGIKRRQRDATSGKGAHITAEQHHQPTGSLAKAPPRRGFLMCREAPAGATFTDRLTMGSGALPAIRMEPTAVR